MISSRLALSSRSTPGRRPRRRKVGSLIFFFRCGSAVRESSSRRAVTTSSFREIPRSEATWRACFSKASSREMVVRMRRDASHSHYDVNGRVVSPKPPNRGWKTFYGSSREKVVITRL